MRSCVKMGIALVIVGVFLLLPTKGAQAAAAQHMAQPRLCGVAQPFGQATSRVYYLYDAHSNYSYGYQFTLSLWKDRCPLAFGAATVQSIDNAAPAGMLSVSVFNCDTKLGGYTRTRWAAPGTGITTVLSQNVPVGSYYFVQAFYKNSSGNEVVFQTGTCVATP
ncbi:MAG: hypothetical protein H0U76_15995 [Ktedonobacteraceae bacterium]|nr:hypothetical protein [Ktedonobacteraceae bacterium]MBA3825189.1 hypothetical protein [Ktedonobacterales bacterium]